MTSYLKATQPRKDTYSLLTKTTPEGNLRNIKGKVIACLTSYEAFSDIQFRDVEVSGTPAETIHPVAKVSASAYAWPGTIHVDERQGRVIVSRFKSTHRVMPAS